MAVAMMVLVSVGCILWALVEHARRLKVERDLRACVTILDRAVTLLDDMERARAFTPLILAQAQRMQDAQDETDALRRNGGLAR